MARRCLINWIHGHRIHSGTHVDWWRPSSIRQVDGRQWILGPRSWTWRVWGTSATPCRARARPSFMRRANFQVFTQRHNFTFVSMEKTRLINPWNATLFFAIRSQEMFQPYHSGHILEKIPYPRHHWVPSHALEYVCVGVCVYVYFHTRGNTYECVWGRKKKVTQTHSLLTLRSHTHVFNTLTQSKKTKKNEKKKDAYTYFVRRHDVLYIKVCVFG